MPALAPHWTDCASLRPAVHTTIATAAIEVRITSVFMLANPRSLAVCGLACCSLACSHPTSYRR